MSTLFDQAETQPEPSQLEEFAQLLESSTAAVRFSVNWIGNQRKATDAQKMTAAEAFDADSKYVSLSKKLLDNKDPTYRKLVEIRGKMEALWKGMTIPYPEPGIRLMKRSKLAVFGEKMDEYSIELDLAVDEFDRRLPNIIENQRRRLGDLFNEAEYPTSIKGLCKVQWYVMSITTPEYLKTLNPALYQQFVERAKNTLRESIMLTEQAFAVELSRMLDHAVERLSGAEDGTPKKFRNTVITNITDFFDRFTDLNPGSSQQLIQIVADAKRIVDNVDPDELRRNRNLRSTISTKLSPVSAALDGFMENRASRNLIDLPSLSL
jgi:hypothetical protein